MQTFAMFAFLCGAVLAFRFTVIVLYPIIGFGTIFTLILGIAAGHSLSSLCLGILVVSVALQIGYLFGAFGRGSMVAARVAVRRRQIAAVKSVDTGLKPWP